MTQTTEKTMIAARIPRDVSMRLAELARREDRSVSSIVRRAVAAELERESSPGALRVGHQATQPGAPPGGPSS